MDTQTIADGTAAIISLIALATLAALWLLSWAERRVRSWLEPIAPVKLAPPKNWQSAVQEPKPAAQDPPQTLTEYLATHRCKGFKPSAHYNSDGDMIECWIADDQCYGKQITPGITVMRSFATGAVVGVQIHGVWRMVVEMETQP